MSKPLNHNQIPFDKIEKYVQGKMTSAQKNAFEKQALNDPFLQDAIDGYLSNPSAIPYFKKNLKPKYKQLSNTKFYLLSFALLSILIGGVLIFKYNQQSNNALAGKNITKPQNNTTEKEIEVLPLELDTLKNIAVKHQIINSDIVESQNKREPFSQTTNQINPPNQTIPLIDVDDVDDEDENIDPIQPNKTKIYPFVYFYNLAVVDYTKYENRTKTINKKTYVLSGTEAIYENNEAKQTNQLIEKKVDVPYMDYLEESMYYFSKQKYKNALKRFQVINQQYKNDLNALFYGGLSNYNLGRFNKAIKNFTQIINLNNNPFYEDALWYRAKTYLQLNQKSNAKTDLENLALTSTYYQKQALQLLNKRLIK